MNNISEPLEVKLNLDQFANRWQKARVSALLRTCDLPSVGTDKTEENLLKQYFSKSQRAADGGLNTSAENLYRAVFDYSRLLGLSLSKFLGLTFEVQDFQELLKKSGIPCAQGNWEERSNARVLNRKGCDFCPQAGAQVCDYWREALDGLVMGLGDKERFVRHACARHGDSTCVDVFYREAGERPENSLAWGTLPEHMSPILSEICHDFENKMKVPVLLKGLREGVLYFEFKLPTDGHCGGGQLLIGAFQRKVQKHYPGLKVQETTPRAVLGVEK